MACLQITLLGAATLRKGESASSLEEFPLGRRKTLALLARLSLSQQPLSRDGLAALLWPDAPDGLAALRRRLAELRKSLGGQWLQVSRSHIALPDHPQLQIDARQFLSAHARAAQARDPVPHLQEAASLYKGELLEGFGLPDSLDFDEWLFFERDRFQAMLNQSLSSLVLELIEARAYERALEHAQRWCALNPLHETAHGQLMRLYAWLGDAARAMHRYDQFLHALETELDVTPSEELQALAEAIRQGKLGHKEPQPPAPRQPPRPRPLPMPPTPFVGRRRELAELRRLLAAPETRLLTLLGPGGMGKTRLALAAAQQQLGRSTHRFSHGVFAVDWEGITDAPAALAAVATGLSFRFHQGPAPERQLLEFLLHKQLLLVVDPCEHFASDADGRVLDFLSQVLRQCPGVVLLAASRERLQLRGERCLPLGGLEVEATEGQAPGVGLFLQTAQRLRPSWSPDAEQEGQIADICGQLGGMPLAIELAAAASDSLPLARLARSLQPEQWVSPQRDRPARHKSLQAIFDLSWQALAPNERRCLARLSRFEGGWSQEAALAVAQGPASGGLPGLRAKALLQHLRGDRFGLHAVLQHFARRACQEGGWEAEAGEAHARYFRSWLQQKALQLRGPDQGQARLALESDAANLRRAWQWFLRADDAEALAEMIDGLWYVLHIGHRLEEGHQLLSGSLGLSPDGPAATRLWMYAAFFAGAAGHSEAMHETCAEAERGLSQQSSMAPGPHQALFGLTQMLCGRHEEGQRRCLRAVEEAKDPWLQATLSSISGGALWMAGDLELAEELLSQSAAHYRSCGDVWGLAHSLQLRGEVALLRDDPQAPEHFEQSLALADDDLHRQMSLHARLSQLRHGDQATHHASQSAAIAEAQGWTAQLDAMLGLLDAIRR